MTWQIFELKQDGKPLQLMLDDRFQADLPGGELPALTRLSVWCAQPPGDYFWNPKESEAIDQIEDDLLRLADEFGEGWVVYVHRRAQPGRLDYCFYSGGSAALDKLAPALVAAHPGYRFEAETSADPAWAQYAGWFAEAAAGTPNPGFMRTPDDGLH